MPIYEYECEKCHKVFEVTQKMSDPPLKKHDECGSKKVKKLISHSSFQLKGSGWYVTDYARKGESGGGKPEGKEDAGEKSTEKSGEKSAEKSTEKSAAPKAEPKADKKSEKKKKSGEKAA